MFSTVMQECRNERSGLRRLWKGEIGTVYASIVHPFLLPPDICQTCALAQVIHTLRGSCFGDQHFGMLDERKVVAGLVDHTLSDLRKL